MIINFKDQGVFNFSGFMEILNKCFNSYFGVDNATLCAAYPSVVPDDNELKLPIITYKYSKVPAELGSVSKNTELKPRLRETIKIYPDGNDSSDGVHVDVWGQTFMYSVSFEVWATNGQQSDELTEKFETFMNTYSPYFKSRGVNNLVFKYINPAQEKNQWRSDLIRREINYEMLLDEITNFHTHSIKNITAGVSTDFSMQYVVLSDEDIQKII
jgi:hypothetical protein